MQRAIFTVCAALSAILLLAACGDDGAATATSTVPAATATPARPTGGATRTVEQPTRPATSTATAVTTPPSDGTVDPLNPGQTDPWTVKANPSNFSGQALLKDVRMGVHPEQGGWERIVFEFDGANLPPATIQYVQGASACGSGQPVSLPGSTVLQVRISQAAAHNSAGNATIASFDMKGPGNTILEGKQTCDFEGVVTWALGLKGKQNFKVTTLQNPTRLVIDIKQ
jgi:hypothetical protein